jgi:C4-type Zn-finger protein
MLWWSIKKRPWESKGLRCPKCERWEMTIRSVYYGRYFIDEHLFCEACGYKDFNEFEIRPSMYWIPFCLRRSRTGRRHLDL